MKSFAAYTLIELVVVMLLSAILMAFLLEGYRFLSRKMIDGNKKNSKIESLLFFDRRMRDDFDKAQFAFLRNDRITLQAHDFSVSYYIGDSCIVRERVDQNDTLQVDLLSKQVKYVNNPLNGCFLVTILELELSLGSRNLALWYEKKYSTKSLINIKESEVNGYEWIRVVYRKEEKKQ